VKDFSTRTLFCSSEKIGKIARKNLIFLKKLGFFHWKKPEISLTRIIFRKSQFLAKEPSKNVIAINC
jgi:hypothetical protein